MKLTMEQIIAFRKITALLDAEFSKSQFEAAKDKLFERRYGRSTCPISFKTINDANIIAITRIEEHLPYTDDVLIFVFNDGTEIEESVYDKMTWSEWCDFQSAHFGIKKRRFEERLVPAENSNRKRHWYSINAEVFSREIDRIEDEIHSFYNVIGCI